MHASSSHPPSLRLVSFGSQQFTSSHVVFVLADAVVQVHVRVWTIADSIIEAEYLPDPAVNQVLLDISQPLPPLAAKALLSAMGLQEHKTWVDVGTLDAQMMASPRKKKNSFRSHCVFLRGYGHNVHPA